MASTTAKHLLQHPSHDHPLEVLDLTNETRTLRCRFCRRKIWGEAYTCQERCDSYYYYHRVCVEAPPQIDRHPLHPFHPLILIEHKRAIRCNACREVFDSGDSSFCCHFCDFKLDSCCALSSLSDVGGYQGGKTSEQITLPIHPHTLTSFSTRHGFVGDSVCNICRGSVEAEGYMCLRRLCEFLIHKRCIQDLYYADGTKAPRVYHGHPLEIFVGEDTGSRTCVSCGSDKSDEFIGCSSCRVFYHRNCSQVPEILQYPSHNPDHTLVLFLDMGTLHQCQSCSSFFEDDIYYRCTSCDFFVHVGCAIQVLAYCNEGMSTKIKLSWHKHPLLLCHRTESASNSCIYCEDKSIGPSYVCEEKYCGFLLHKHCTEIESTITHPHHPDHPLTLCGRDGDDHYLQYYCIACGETADVLKFSCERCLVGLHVKCAARFPTHKHCLHEHKLLHSEKHGYMECNRCGGRSTDSPFFRCVPCNFNLHEDCMELPQVVTSKIHWHPLTLHETFVEDDSGEYYCEQCEETRDPRLGVYVCGQCKLELPRIYHIECVLPELRKVNRKKGWHSVAVKELNDRITDKKEELCAIKEKLEEATRELDELVEQLKRQIKEDYLNINTKDVHNRKDAILKLCLPRR